MDNPSVGAMVLSNEIPKAVRIRGIIACLLASFVVTYGAVSIGGAIDDIKASLNLTTSEALWLMYAPVVTTLAWNLIAIVLADRYGKKDMMATGIIILLTMNCIPLFTNNYTLIVTSRLIMGIGMSLVYVSSVSILADLSGDRLHTTTGLFSSISYVGEMTVVIIGFLFAQRMGWELLIIVTIPLAAVTLFLLKGVPNVKNEEKKRISVIDHVLFNLSVFLTLFGLVSFPITDYGEYCLVIGLIILAIFIYRQFDKKNRVIDAELFDNQSFRIAVITAFVFYCMSYSVQQMMTSYIQISEIENMLVIGTIMICVRNILIIFLSPFLSTVSKKFRETTFPMFGILLAFASLTMMALLPFGGLLGLVAFAAACVATACATSMFSGSNMTIMMRNVGAEERNSASAINNLVRQICKIVGALFLVIFLSYFSESQQAYAFELCFTILAIFCSLLTVIGLYSIIRFVMNDSNSNIHKDADR